jgi:hypothetical protein
MGIGDEGDAGLGLGEGGPHKLGKLAPQRGDVSSLSIVG